MYPNRAVNEWSHGLFLIFSTACYTRLFSQVVPPGCPPGVVPQWVPPSAVHQGDQLRCFPMGIPYSGLLLGWSADVVQYGGFPRCVPPGWPLRGVPRWVPPWVSARGVVQDSVSMWSSIVSRKGRSPRCSLIEVPKGVPQCFPQWGSPKICPEWRSPVGHQMGPTRRVPKEYPSRGSAMWISLGSPPMAPPSGSANGFPRRVPQVTPGVVLQGCSSIGCPTKWCPTLMIP
jgi:hypothetical protein